MVHKHHIIPKYAGGTDDPSNIVELTPTQHAMWHWAEWQRKQNYLDFCAHKLILGDVKNPEFRSARAKAFGSKNGKRCHEIHPHLAKENAKKGNKAQRESLAGEGRTIAEKAWIVTNPEGEEFQIRNMAKFCRENDLDKGKMSGVASGNRKHHKGWKCRKLG
jgi:hypothetical protein